MTKTQVGGRQSEVRYLLATAYINFKLAYAISLSLSLSLSSLCELRLPCKLCQRKGAAHQASFYENRVIDLTDVPLLGKQLQGRSTHSHNIELELYVFEKFHISLIYF